MSARSGLIVAAAAMPVVLGIVACRAPSMDSAHFSGDDAEGGSSSMDLGPYLAIRPTQTRWYRQKNTKNPKEPAARYGQMISARGRVEGSLIGRLSFPLEKYFDPHSNRPERPYITWPTGKERVAEAILLEFDEPVVEWPPDIPPATGREYAVRIRAFDRKGVPFAKGSLRRRVHLGGTETVVLGEKTFDDAVRLEADTSLWFGWWAYVNLRETVWFVRDIGMVRRVEQFSGAALLVFRFGSSYEYEIDPASLSQSGDASGGVKPSVPKWIRLAVGLKRGVPKPRVGGLAVEWAEPLAGPDK